MSQCCWCGENCSEARASIGYPFWKFIGLPTLLCTSCCLIIFITFRYFTPHAHIYEYYAAVQFALCVRSLISVIGMRCIVKNGTQCGYNVCINLFVYGAESCMRPMQHFLVLMSPRVEGHGEIHEKDNKNKSNVTKQTNIGHAHNTRAHTHTHTDILTKVYIIRATKGLNETKMGV